jgi:hypothetical protein
MTDEYGIRKNMKRNGHGLIKAYAWKWKKENLNQDSQWGLNQAASKYESSVKAKPTFLTSKRCWYLG